MNINDLIKSIPEAEKTDTVKLLLELVQVLVKENQQLKDEIARLKNRPPRPRIKPSVVGENSKSEFQKRNKRKNRDKKSIVIANEIIITPNDLPPGSVFLWYRDYIVQDIIIKPNNTKYRRGVWKTPDGRIVRGDLPQEIDGHYSASLKSYIIHMYYGLHVTRPLILEHLLDLGFKISVGEIDLILTEDKGFFHTEKSMILETGLQVSKYIVTDDTGARHAGKNGYCTHIGNEFFAWYKSTTSKSRINFLELLRGSFRDYYIDEYSAQYMRAQGFPYPMILLLERSVGKKFSDKQEWDAYLKFLGVRHENHIKIATEGALIGSILLHGVSRELSVVSDDAGQFNVFRHGLCWIHAERKIDTLIPESDEQNAIMQTTLDKFWALYRELKEYKISPTEMKKIEINDQFERFFTENTTWPALNKALQANHKNKSELLLVLTRPEIPLNNNISENDIREAVKKRKISAGTRSISGRECRDTFLSLKKTCRKLGISFWEYILDRISHKNNVQFLPDIIREKAWLPP